MRAYGIPEKGAQCAITGLFEMEHHVRTVYGDSDDYYRGDKWAEEGLHPHGNGQGNGDGPALWACISSPLLRIMREMGYGVEFCSPITKKVLHLSAIGFVDDTDYIQMARPGETDQEVTVKVQEGMALCDYLLQTTGGALELSDAKSDFINIGFEWKNGRSKMKKKDESLSISVCNNLGILQNVRQLNPTDARETLGVFQAADGSEEAQDNKLKKKVKDWVGNIE